MSLVHTPIAWGCIVGVTLLGCLAGCSLQQEPVPLPSVPHAHEEVAPAPVPKAPAPQRKKLLPQANPRPPRSARPPGMGRVSMAGKPRAARRSINTP